MSQIHDAIAYAKQHIADGEHMDDLMMMLRAKWPDINPRNIIMLAGGWVEGWDEKKATVSKRSTVKV